MRKMKLISGCAAIALAVTGLGGCSNSQSKNRAQAASLDDNFASVYIYEDNAVVFSRDYELWSDDGRGYIYGDEEFFYGNNVFYIRYKDKDELEDKIEAFIGEDANITYYGEIGNAKSLS